MTKNLYYSDGVAHTAALNPGLPLTVSVYSAEGTDGTAQGLANYYNKNGNQLPKAVATAQLTVTGATTAYTFTNLPAGAYYVAEQFSMRDMGPSTRMAGYGSIQLDRTNVIWYTMVTTTAGNATTPASATFSNQTSNASPPLTTTPRPTATPKPMATVKPTSPPSPILGTILDNLPVPLAGAVAKTGQSPQTLLTELVGGLLLIILGVLLLKRRKREKTRK